jgi:hypothetical protein
MNPGSKNATIGIDESLIDMEGFEGGFDRMNKINRIGAEHF